METVRLGGLDVPVRIRYTWLRKMNACSKHITRFRRVFPSGMELTAPNLVRAAEAGLDVGWLFHQCVYAMDPSTVDQVAYDSSIRLAGACAPDSSPLWRRRRALVWAVRFVQHFNIPARRP